MKDKNEGKGKVTAFIAVLLVGVVAGGVWMHSNNRARERYLDSQYERLDQERDSIMLMKGMSDAEFRRYAAAVHEQSRIARDIQERLHVQELALTGAENGWIHLVIAALVATVLAALWIGKSTDDRARVTIQNAVGLPPNQMREYLFRAQMAASASVPKLDADGTGAGQPPPKRLERGRGAYAGFRPPSQGGGKNRGGGQRNKNRRHHS